MATILSSVLRTLDERSVMAAIVAAPAVEVEAAFRSLEAARAATKRDPVSATADTMVAAEVSTVLPRVTIPSPNVVGPK